MTSLPYGNDQFLDPAMPRALHADACRDHAIVASLVLWDLPAYPERFAARLVTSGAMPSPYVLLADTLGGIRDQLPPGLVRSERMPVDSTGRGGDLVCRIGAEPDEGRRRIYPRQGQAASLNG
jgi:hypothetical protein